MLRFFYNLIIAAYGLLVRIAAIRNPKAAKWVDGRKHLWETLESWPGRGSGPVWMHCASLGEFEQGRPLIEGIKNNYPGKKILITFFSPSGYEVRKNYAQADLVCYLPLDTPGNAARFLEVIKPSVAIFIKYEFWFNYLHLLQKQRIPVFLASAVFRKNHYIFRPYGKWALRHLMNFTYIFTQDEASAARLTRQGFENHSVTGDTRFDRVFQLPQQKREFPLIEKFAGNNPVMVCGSTWPEDEKVVCSWINEGKQQYKYILAPHEVSEQGLARLEKMISRATLRYSLANENNASAEVLIIDSVGILSMLYRFARVAYIGGAFGSGLHNILEAATYGIPVVFGPVHQKFPEAAELIEGGGGFSITDAAGMAAVMELLGNTEVYNRASSFNLEYIRSRQGATDRIMEVLQVYLS